MTSAYTKIDSLPESDLWTLLFVNHEQIFPPFKQNVCPDKTILCFHANQYFFIHLYVYDRTTEESSLIKF